MQNLTTLLNAQNYPALFVELDKISAGFSTIQKNKYKELRQTQSNYEPAIFFEMMRLFIESISIETTNKTLQVLMLSANPSNTSEMELRKEHSYILSQLQENDIIQIDAFFSVSKTELLAKCLEFSPTVIHITAHNTSEGIALQDDSKSNSDALTTMQIAYFFEYLAMQNFGLQCVLLSVSNSAMHAQSIAQNVSYAIGTTAMLTEAQRIAFSTGFYMQLAKDATNYERAFLTGKVRAVLEGVNENDFVLYKKN